MRKNNKDRRDKQATTNEMTATSELRYFPRLEEGRKEGRVRWGTVHY